jgi:membrane-associated protease RseP (regulator of RpoE activity)
MDFQLASAIAFVVLLGIFLYLQRKKLTLQKVAFPFLYFLMRRSKLGLRSMEATAKRYGRLTRVLGIFGIVIGFIGMGVMAFALIQNIVKILTVPEAVSGVQLVLPFKLKGSFYVPFFYWIASITVIATIHEFSHGVVAQAYKMKIKSSGFAFLAILVPILPAAFVEPNEKELTRSPRKQQLSVYAAGPFSNILLGMMVLGIFLLTVGPVSNLLFENTGVEVTGLVESDIIYPAKAVNISPGELITGIDNNEIKDTDAFVSALSSKKPGDLVDIRTNKSEYTVTLAKNPANQSKPYLGVYVQQKSIVKPSVQDSVGSFVPAAAVWLYGLLYWLYILNLGIGLFNLVPLGPLDGGRMLLVALQNYTDKKRAAKYWRLISTFFLALIITNLVFSFIR